MFKLVHVYCLSEQISLNNLTKWMKLKIESDNFWQKIKNKFNWSFDNAK